jgi:hypothetical protein
MLLIFNDVVGNDNKIRTEGVLYCQTIQIIDCKQINLGVEFTGVKRKKNCKRKIDV